MARIVIAFRAFFATLFSREVATRVDRALHDQLPALPQPTTPAPATPAASPLVPKRAAASEALILLSALQREARLIDFLKEDLSAYSDDQVGAAVREIHRDAGKVVERFFAIRPILSDDEGATVEVARGFDAARYRLTGKVAGEAPFRGSLRHHGWEATQSELPDFTGSESAARVVAPAEIEIG